MAGAKRNNENQRNRNEAAASIIASSVCGIIMAYRYQRKHQRNEEEGMKA